VAKVKVKTIEAENMDESASQRSMVTLRDESRFGVKPEVSVEPMEPKKENVQTVWINT
jgi:hypothetical protein